MISKMDIPEAMDRDLKNRLFSEHKERFVMKHSVNRKKIISVAAAVAVLTVIPGSVYAYSKISNSAIEKTAPYQNTVKIDLSADNDAEFVSESESSEQYMMYELGYIPAGYEYNEDGPYAGKYHSTESGGGISVCFYHIPDNMEHFRYDMRFSENCENYESNEKNAMINYRTGYGNSEGHNFGREVWISFTDTRYVLQLYVTDDISREDLIKIIDNTSLYPVDRQMGSEYFDRLNTKSTYSASYESPVKADSENVFTVDDTVLHDYYGPTAIIVNSMELTDSFEGLTADICGLPEETFSKFKDENNNMVPNTRTWYKAGNGIDSLDEDIISYDMPFHILKTKVTFENRSDHLIDYCIFPYILSIDSEGSLTKIPDDPDMPEGYSNRQIRSYDAPYNRFNSESFLAFYADESYKGTKNHLILDAGESTDVEILCVVSENVLNSDSYICFGTSYKDSPIIKISAE